MKTYELTFTHPNKHDPREYDAYRLKVEAKSAPESLDDFDGGTAVVAAGYQTTDDDFDIEADTVRPNTIHLIKQKKSVWTASQRAADLQCDSPRGGHDCLKGEGRSIGKSLTTSRLSCASGKEIYFPEIRDVTELRPSDVVGIDIYIGDFLGGLETTN